MGRHSITAIIQDKRGRTLSIGRNQYEKTHPLQARMAMDTGTPMRVFLHAEISALVKCKDWRKAYKIVVTRYTKDGKPALAKPCAACERAIALAGIKLVEHT